MLPLASYVGVVAPEIEVISFCSLCERVCVLLSVVTVSKFPSASKVPSLRRLRLASQMPSFVPLSVPRSNR